jgi:hypothetical protein
MDVQDKALEALGPAHWPELYRLMVARGFPDVPPRYDEAVPFFKRARPYGLMRGSEIMAGFVFGEPEDGIAFFDVVCARASQGVWATPGVLAALFRLAFDEMKLRCVWVQPHGKAAIKAALQGGFVAATPLDGPSPVLVMTPALLPKRFRKENEYGKFV